MASPFKDSPTLIVPREFGFLLSCGGQLYRRDMTAHEQLDLAARIIEVAMQRLKGADHGEEQPSP